MQKLERSEGRGPSRREVIALGVGAFVVATVPFARGRRQLVRRAVPMMGTVAEFAVLHRDRSYANGAIDAAIARLRQMERVMTRFSATSDVGRANRLASRDGVPVTSATALVLEEALVWAETTRGCFDPCIGMAVEKWDIGRRREPLSPEETGRIARSGLYRALEVDQTPGRPARVRFHDPAIQLDLGGIAKGYGVDQAVAVLREWGISNALVNVGGDLFALGQSNDGDPWKVGVRSPDRPTEWIETLAVEEAAVATSGDYLQYFEHHGRRYHHLIDPATGAPRVSEMRSVSIMANDCMTADAAATAVFGQPIDASRDLLARRGGARIVHWV
jgi:thiamine biosynthesis lipoprotein